MFLYFAPGKHSAVPASLRYAFDDARNIAFRGSLEGPGGASGTVISCGIEGAGYFPSRQEWRRIPATDCFVGRNVDDPLPTAEQLARSAMLAGHNVELGGQDWKVPVARSWTSEARWVIALPRKVEMNDDGEWMFAGVIDRYRRLWEIGEIWFDEVFDRGVPDEQGVVQAQLELDQAFTLACEALAYNYRVGPIELSILGVLDSDSHVNILNAVIDWQRLNDLVAALTEKKSGDSAAA